MLQLKGLQRVRKARGLSQDQLAEGAGLTQRTISLLERGEREARQSTAKKLARVLFVPVKEIAEEEGYVTPEAAAQYAKSRDLELA